MKFTYEYTRIEKVVDGDTVIAVLDLGFGIYLRKYIRLEGINTPELPKKPDPTDHAVRAKDRVQDLLLGEKAPEFVILTTTRKLDKYGRLLARINFRDGAGQEHDLTGLLLSEDLGTPLKS